MMRALDVARKWDGNRGVNSAATDGNIRRPPAQKNTPSL
jgi:hypothetical protein